MTNVTKRKKEKIPFLMFYVNLKLNCQKSPGNIVKGKITKDDPKINVAA
jgi:hypothetical protein